MKTLHLTNAYHPTSGGIRHFYEALLAAAGRSENLQIRLVVPSGATRVEDLNANARIYHVRAPRAPLFDRRYRLLLPNHVLAPQGAIARILRAEQPDLVEVCDKYSLCYLAGALRRGWIDGVRRPVLVGLSCERMDDNVASRKHPRSVRVVPMGVETDRFGPTRRTAEARGSIDGNASPVSSSKPTSSSCVAQWPRRR